MLKLLSHKIPGLTFAVVCACVCHCQSNSVPFPVSQYYSTDSMEERNDSHLFQILLIKQIYRTSKLKKTNIEHLFHQLLL